MPFLNTTRKRQRAEDRPTKRSVGNRGTTVETWRYFQYSVARNAIQLTRHREWHLYGVKSYSLLVARQQQKRNPAYSMRGNLTGTFFCVTMTLVSLPLTDTEVSPGPIAALKAYSASVASFEGRQRRWILARRRTVQQNSTQTLWSGEGDKGRREIGLARLPPTAVFECVCVAPCHAVPRAGWGGAAKAAIATRQAFTGLSTVPAASNGCPGWSKSLMFAVKHYHVTRHAARLRPPDASAELTAATRVCIKLLWITTGYLAP